MSGWKQKRFWKTAGLVPEDGGFAVELDGRRVKTPAKAPLVVPTRAMAQAIADEWNAQGEMVNPLVMPVTRSANAAIDKVVHQHAEVADMLVGYGETDLLCYRADRPEGLCKRQAEQWDPALDWAAETLGARLEPRVGIVHAPQPAGAIRHLSEKVHAMSPFQLAAFHDLVSLSGSLILGFAAARDWKSANQIWQISRLDELWQQESWGKDDEAESASEKKRQAFGHAKRFFNMAS
jgi:chaperone required for assembly of F1-ATPase